MEEKLVRRFIRYVKLNTASDPRSNTIPSSKGQIRFASLLAAELQSIGLHDAVCDENGYVMATIPSNIPAETATAGFIAHMDTSPDYRGKNIHPRIIRKYDGGKIVLNEENGLALDPAEFPALLNYAGQTLITTDGTTLLGADDKAGIAAIVTAADILMRNPGIGHGRIRICFTPDEEIGQGTRHFDLDKFGASFAYTIDGGELGELQYENFNAARALISVSGKPVHPGEAKGKMVNALLVAHQLTGLFPPEERPDNTDGYEGFFHLSRLTGDVSLAEIECFIREHDREKFIQKKQLLESLVNQVNAGYHYTPVTMELTDQYYNMREKIEKAMHVVSLASDAITASGVTPKIVPVRGGTDGAYLSWKGLPCPNIFTGGHNFHGPYEFIPLESMVKAVKVIVNICRMIPEKEIKP